MKAHTVRKMNSVGAVKPYLLTALILVCLRIDVAIGDIGCLDNHGNPVDWFVVLKMPRLNTSHYDTVKNGAGQLYMDVNNPTLALLEKGIDEVGGHAVYNTLQQIYDRASDENVAYLMYNDGTDDDYFSDNGGSNFGHTKGDLCFEHKSTGFWLVHSVPHFPKKASDGMGYGYPSTGHRYGQSFLCVTYGYDQLDLIAQQMLYNHPLFFDKNVPKVFSAENPHLAQLVTVGRITEEPWNNKVTLTSLAGHPFTSFAKSLEYGQDLYEWVANDYQSDIYVDSWQHNKTKELPSICDAKYKVLNVAKLKYLDISFSEWFDHSKWVVTYNSEINIICIGDINRETNQVKRNGGTVCTELPTVAETLRSAVVKTKPCGSVVHDEI